MDEISTGPTRTNALTPERVAASAIQQAARHEHALRTCLAELRGTDSPTSELAATTRHRATRHAERAISLTRTAIRVNRDPLAGMFLASLLERHERNALLVERLETATDGALLAAAV